jgi:hypothetical protein
MKNFPHIVLQVLLLSFILVSLGCARQFTVQVHGDSLSFAYKDAKATEIFFASSVDNFQYHPAARGSGNVWHVTIPLHKDFSYFYIVDGMVTLPECPNTALDDFGGKNCFYVHGM